MKLAFEFAECWKLGSETLAFIKKGSKIPRNNFLNEIKKTFLDKNLKNPKAEIKICGIFCCQKFCQIETWIIPVLERLLKKKVILIDIMLEYVKLINLKGKDHLEKASVLKILLKIQGKK